MGINDTPRSNRIHIGIFGKRNSGKSSLINYIANHEVALVSDIPGTTTDPVYKSIEINGIGPCVLIDTAGFDDIGDLGEMRVERTSKILTKCDIAIMLFCDSDIIEETMWANKLKDEGIPIIPVISKSDTLKDSYILVNKIKEIVRVEPIIISSKNHVGIEKLIESLIKTIPHIESNISILRDLVKRGDKVLLVMPQDIQAPKGRLILPQVQTIRELLDNNCIVISCTIEQYKKSLSFLKTPPDLIITDSQAFKKVYDLKPEISKLTSFSVLFAAYKGDIDEFIKGASMIDRLNQNSKVLISEACTHVPLEEDIGRVKIPRLLRKKVGDNLKIDIKSGTDFPEDLGMYDLIIHCGACMFNRRYVMSRINSAKAQGIAITNYGVALAKLMGILDYISY